MAKDIETIKEEIEDFKTENGGDYADYYIGITNDINRRMVESNEQIVEHIQNGEYTVGNPTYTEECESRDDAVEIERHFQSKGMEKFNPRSFGVEESKYIYCYKMTEENKAKILEGNSQEGKDMAKIIRRFEDFKPE